ncbi:MAG: hypothetical protein M0017_13955 [Desulfobacteraceae bacterium]|nr:hypothetical protein [Desulfobacteraceae bacterium]
MDGKKEEKAVRPPKSESTIESYHDIAASKEAYEAAAGGEAAMAGEVPPAGERARRKAQEGPIPEMVRREREWLVGTARERGRRFLSARMTSLATVAQDIAEVLHNSAQRLSAEEDTATAHYFDMAAERVDKMAATLRSHDLETFVSRTREAARSHPVLFFGGMATAGFMVSRFLKSSPEEADWERTVEYEQGFGPEVPTKAARDLEAQTRQSRPYGAVEKPEYAR